MSRKLELVVVICAVTLLVSIISHGITTWLKIETAPGGYWVLGPDEGAPTFAAGSSLARDAISLRFVADTLNLRLEGWGLAGSSPSEWERFQHLVTYAKLAILVVSVYDLNEYFLSDYRAHVVPLTQTLQDLQRSHVDGSFSKRLLSMYPLTYVRTLFPSAGRSTGVIRGLRGIVEKYLSPAASMENESPPTFSFDDFRKDKITEWSQGMMLRRLVAMRNACLGKHDFNGPKRIAFLRMLDRAKEQGTVSVVVLPVSTAYAKELLSAEVKQNFEETLTDLQKIFPNIKWIRLDQVDELSANEYFQDLVHMNSYGQKIVTEIILDRLKRIVNPS